LQPWAAPGGGAPHLAPRMGQAGIFAASVAMMSLQPLLINLAASSEQPPPADAFMVAAEILKVLLCTAALLCRRAAGLEAALWCGFGHSAAFAVPAVLYLVMNVLKVLAARALAPPLFQLLASTKIIATAVTSWTVLGKSLTPLQWAAMVLLTAGVALGQHRDDGGVGRGSGGPTAELPLLSVAIMLLNSCLSAFAAVYTERVLKARQSASLSIFAANLHMASHTLLASLAKACVSEAPVFPHPRELGWRTWAALGNEAANGILVSTLMRHADSNAKNYAFGTSIFTTALIAAPVLDYWPQRPFFLGSLLVLCSMAMYTYRGRPESAKKSA